MIEQAELNRAFFQDMASRAELFGRHGEPSRAELFCPKARAKTEPSRALARTQHQCSGRKTGKYTCHPNSFCTKSSIARQGLILKSSQLQGYKLDYYLNLNNYHCFPDLDLENIARNDKQIKSDFCIVRFSHSRVSIFMHDLWACFINHARQHTFLQSSSLSTADNKIYNAFDIGNFRS